MSRLTEEMVIARSKQSDLSSIKKLNCWGSELSDVSIIKRMHGVEVLALSVNKVTSLSEFENCLKLQELYLRKNNVQDIQDLVYLQGLPHLRNLWLEENPCVEKAGPNYRQIVLRALPNLKKLDNVDVTPEEVAEALRGLSLQEEEVYEESYNGGQQQAQSPQQNNHHQQQYQQDNHPTPQQHQQQNHHQPPVQQQQQQQWRSSSPVREQPRQSPDNTEESISDPIERNSNPTSPLQRTSPNQDYSPAEPKYNNRDHRNSYHQSYDRSPGSDHGSPMMGYKERGPIPPSMSTHSMKEYYQSDRPTPPYYRHSQTDLTEWDENPQNDHGRSSHPAQPHRRSGPPEREPPFNNGYQYRNGTSTNAKDKSDEWEEPERNRRDSRTRRSEGRFNDNVSVMSNAVLSHYASLHRRPVNRSSNLLSATLCLVKELDYPSLEVVEHAVRCRIDELATE